MTIGGTFGDWEEAWGGEVAVTNSGWNTSLTGSSSALNSPR